MSAWMRAVICGLADAAVVGAGRGPLWAIAGLGFAVFAVVYTILVFCESPQGEEGER